MDDLRVVLSYELKMKVREIKSMVKNLFIGLMIMSIVFLWMTFQFGKMIISNLELINFYSNQIILGISIVIITFTLMNKKAPLRWHPASMIHLSGCKFRTIFKLSLLKKTIAHAFLSIAIALSLSKFKISFQTMQVFLSIYNLLTISLISRYFTYNKGLKIKIVKFLLIHTAMLNFQLYLNKYLSMIVILSLTYISVLSIKEVLNIDFNFNKSFIDMDFINRINSLAKGNIIEDTQEFVRETTAEKSRKNPILKNMKFKNPLIQKNVITFSRINLTVSFYIFIIFTAAIVLYRFEIFDFVRLMKELDLGVPILALNQTLFISNIINLISDQKKLLIVKSKEGLYLPYKAYEINQSFMVLGIPILFIAALMVGTLLQKPIWITGIALFFY